MPILHNTACLLDVADANVDIIQHPFSLKRLGFNFIFTPEISSLYNECFNISTYDRIKVLEKKRDYYVSNPMTKNF